MGAAELVVSVNMVGLLVMRLLLEDVGHITQEIRQFMVQEIPQVMTQIVAQQILFLVVPVELKHLH